jgi:hypothetical protein
MNSLQLVSSIKTKSRKNYYDKNALKAYKEDIKSYKKGIENDSYYSYETINDFLKVNNVNIDGINLINIKTTKVNREKAKNIIEIVKGIDKRMVPYTSKNKLYKGITHISKRTLDDNMCVIYKSYSSTTIDYQIAASFANTETDDYRIVLILTVQPEIKVYNYMDKHNENEILLERNTIISNFVYNSYDKKNNVHVYEAIVSKYNPLPLYIPSKGSPDFLNLKINKNLPPKKMKIFDINKTLKILSTKNNTRSIF